MMLGRTLRCLLPTCLFLDTPTLFFEPALKGLGLLAFLLNPLLDTPLFVENLCKVGRPLLLRLLSLSVPLLLCLDLCEGEHRRCRGRRP